MPPKTRSATTTPIKAEDSPSTTPRKAPRCSKCGRPRAGHPRSGCPYDDTPSKTSSASSKQYEDEDEEPVAETASPAKGRRKLGSEDINDALGSMYITPSSPNCGSEEEARGVVQERRRKSRSSQIRPLETSDTLLSLTTSSNEIIESLLEPGALGDDGEDTTEQEDNGRTTPTKKPSRIVKWQETLRAATPKSRKSGLFAGMPKSSRSSPMPGTLITPNDSFFDSHTSILDEEKPLKTEATSPDATILALNAQASRQTKPLSRSMSMEERDEFISKLGTASQAMIHVVPKNDAWKIADEAHRLGFLARVVTNENPEDHQSLLIIGREEREVGKLLARVEAVERTKAQAAAGVTSNLPVAAGALAAGAVGTWGYLAYS